VRAKVVVMRLLATSLGPIHGDAFHPALLILCVIAAAAIGWVIWEFYIRDKTKDR
jgi:lipopolysaccharide export LptBFGC system permease protein LptF